MLHTLAKWTHRAVGRVKKVRRHAKRRLGMFGPLQIIPFRGYGTASRLFVSGRVVEAKGVVAAVGDHTEALARRDHGDPSSAWTNFRATMRRFRSDEVPGTRLALRYGRMEVETTTDAEGYFDVTLELSRPVEHGWHEVQVEVLSSPIGDEGTVSTAEVLVPPEDAEFGVISDLDDTVLETKVLHRLQMIRIVLFHDAKGRMPFPGVGAFYRALKLGSDGRRSNPIFYVSKSPWNLYDLFDAFFALNDIPRGPIFLRDLSFLEGPSRALGAGQDKLTRIRKLLATYPRMAFVLVGDSGQKDPEIYRQVALEHPGRIKAIYIRDVTARRSRDRVVHDIADQLREAGVPTVLSEDTHDAAAHAARAGLICGQVLNEIDARAEQDAHPALPGRQPTRRAASSAP